MSATLTWNTPAPLRLRVGACVAVVLAHVVVIGAVLVAKHRPVEVQPPEETVQVRFVELAPQVQQAPTPPVPKPEPKPEPPKPQPPKPQPKPTPAPKPEPKPLSDTALSTPEPQPVAPPAPPPPAAAPTAPEPAKPAAPPAPVSNEPRRIGQIDYAGTPHMPEYPRASTRMHEEGRVVIRVVINTSGGVTSATVEQSSGFPRLDAAALETARQERFKPYTENGVAYPASATVPYVFSLRN